MQALELTAAHSPSYSHASALISALDTMNKSHSATATATATATTPCHQYGENNHIEYKAVDLSNANANANASVVIPISTLQEKIMQFHFQLVRTSDANTIQCIAKDTRDILSAVMSGISKNSENNNNLASDEYKTYMDMGITMFKILAHTRDIVSGKGEYMLFYVMLIEWAKLDFRFFDFMIRSLVYDTSNLDTDSQSHSQPHPKHPLGSWKDMKYFLTYMKAELIDSVQPQAQAQQAEAPQPSRFYLSKTSAQHDEKPDSIGVFNTTFGLCRPLSVSMPRPSQHQQG